MMRLMLVLALAPACFEARAAELKLSGVFTDGMVLQRDREVPVWGWADPNEQISVKLLDKSASATADAQGRWRVTLGPFTAGGPHEMTVSGKKTITLKNVLIGDVWLCSGQSNMDHPLHLAQNAQVDLPAANHPQIRLLFINRKISVTPVQDVLPLYPWQECTPAAARGFSAVAYYFGKHLHEKYKVPIGLIQASWGGTPAETWTSEEALTAHPDFKPVVEKMRETRENPALHKQYEQALGEWQKVVDAADEEKKAGANWADPALDTQAWTEMTLPQRLESMQGLEKLDGVVWFRRKIDIPAAWAGKKLVLALGGINDADVTFLNGVQVGTTSVADAARVYKIAADAFKAGANVVAIKVTDIAGPGGFAAKPEQMQLSVEGDAAATLALAGQWQYRISSDYRKHSPRPTPPLTVVDQNSPTALYNSMIAPLVSYGIRGVIWYQGESNSYRAYQYRTLFPITIQDWRKRWGQGDFPFLFVQIANYTAPRRNQQESHWAELREAQTMALSLPKTGMAVTIDIGEEKDVHPKNKHDVGGRLALAARAIEYGENIVYSGPIFKEQKIEGNKIRLSFNHTGGGLMAKGDDKIKHLSIAGADKKFVWATATIDGDTVIASSPEVPNPVAVRYNWAENPNGNLYNKEGLPASPFRTDDWPGMTVNAK
jgi:sialate O-acetylesterase